MEKLTRKQFTIQCRIRDDDEDKEFKKLVISIAKTLQGVPCVHSVVVYSDDFFLENEHIV